MDRFIKFMNESFAPRINKLTQNVWVSSIQDAIMTTLPLILVGSLVTLVSLLNEVFPGMPDFSPINMFSFGLLGVFVTFLIPYFIMEKKGVNNQKILAGLTRLSLYLMLLIPDFSEDGEAATFVFERFGAVGMFVAIILGLIVGIVMSYFSNISFFKDSTSLPDFVITWFDSLLPITVLFLIGWLMIYQFNLDMFELIVNIFKPFETMGLSFIGVFLYSFGISPWVLMPVIFPIMVQGIEQNASLVAQGADPIYINTWEVIYSGWVAVGGIGTTLPLAILMLFARSSRLKATGKAVIVPSIFNINEPVVFGGPIVFNPMLMIPFWLNGLIIPALTYGALSTGIFKIPSEVFQLWYVPFPIATYLVSNFKGVLLLLGIIAVSFIIWYPFFKAYDIQETEKEAKTSD